MAISAVSNGGGVAAAGAVAALQSTGAAGYGLGTKVAIVTTSGGMYNYIFGSRTERDVESIKKQNENWQSVFFLFSYFLNYSTAFLKLLFLRNGALS